MKHMHCQQSRHSAWLLAVTLSALAATGVHAQMAPESRQPLLHPPQALIGLVVNGPDQLRGAGVAWLPPALGGWGLYVDFKMDADSPGGSDALVAITAEEALESGDEHRFNDRSFTSVNAAVVRAFRPDLLMYLGGGISTEKVYAHLFDPTGSRGQLGLYWAEYADEGGPRPNILGGFFFRIQRRLALQFGAEALPYGVTIGAHLAL